jgi:ABC-2 type transport system permease protein
MVYEFARISLKSQLEYRMNFISGVFVESAYMCIKMTYLIVVVNNGAIVGGLSPAMMAIFIGTFMFMTGIAMLLSGVFRLGVKILRGELDQLMVKPGSLLFLQTMGSFDFAMAFPNCGCGIAVILWGWQNAGIPVTGATLGGFLFFMAVGIFMTYGFTLIPQILGFWVSSFGGVYAVFWALWDYNNMPMNIYPRLIRDIGTFVVPVFLVTNWAGLFAMGRLTALEIAWWIVVPILVFIIAHIMWKFGLRRYTSVNG